jgi:transposase
LEGDEIAARLGRSPRFVDQWLARYRGGGMEALRPRKASGRPPRLAAGRRAEFKARFLGGPTAADDGVCALRGLDAQRILKAEFGAEMKLSGVYELMRRLNLSLLKPRPLHPKNDPEQAKQWLERAPLLRGS